MKGLAQYSLFVSIVSGFVSSLVTSSHDSISKIAFVHSLIMLVGWVNHWATWFLALVREGKREALMAGIDCWKVIVRRSSSF